MNTEKIVGYWQACWRQIDQLSPRRALQIALGIWIIYAVVIATIVAIQPDRRTATIEYQKATSHWWGGETSLYRKKNGYLYFPQFAILYTPYELLPDRVGEPLWRLTCLALLASALWLAASRLSKTQKESLFLAATILVLPSSFASARNGQVNMPLAALFLLIALMLARERWWVSAGLLILTLILKPIAAAPILLCTVLYPKLRFPVVIGLIVFTILPYAHFNWEYVTGEYQAFIHNLTQAGLPTGRSWCDFAGMLQCVGIHISSTLQLVIRALAGLLVLGIAWQALRTLDALRGAFSVLLLSVIYLMLFNPRTETNSYIILGSFIAIYGAYSGLVSKDLKSAALFAIMALILGTENYGWPIFPLTNLWLKALATSLFAIWFTQKIFKAEVLETLSATQRQLSH